MRPGAQCLRGSWGIAPAKLATEGRRIITVLRLLTASDTNIPQGVQERRLPDIWHSNNENIQFRCMWIVFRDACAEIRSLIDMGVCSILEVIVPTRSSFKALISRGLFQEAKKVLWSGYLVAKARLKGYCDIFV